MNWGLFDRYPGLQRLRSLILGHYRSPFRGFRSGGGVSLLRNSLDIQRISNLKFEKGRVWKNLELLCMLW